MIKNQRLFFSQLNKKSMVLEPKDDVNIYNRKEEFQLICENIKPNITFKGMATHEGLNYFKSRNSQIDFSHFKSLYNHQNLKITSLSQGTYKGDINQDTDIEYFNSLVDGTLGGFVNYIDTSINFRYQKSERLIKKVLMYLIHDKLFQREELLIGTKGGYLHEDGDSGETYDQVIEKLCQKGVIGDFDKEFFEYNSLSPKFIDYQFEKSRRNLGVDTIDYYFINQPEVHLSYLNQDQLIDKLIKIFEILETKIEEGKLQKYGISTWRAFRTDHHDQYYLNLEKLVNRVRNTFGQKCNFNTIQAPSNFLQPEIFLEAQQDYQDQKMTLLKVASELQINVFTTSPFCSGLTANLPLPTHLTKMSYLAAKHLNFLRSLPYDSLKTVIFEAKNNRHLKINLSTIKGEFMSEIDIEEFLLNGKIRKQQPLQDYPLKYLSESMVDIQLIQINNNESKNQ